jgi:hypothetical protein
MTEEQKKETEDTRGLDPESLELLKSQEFQFSNQTRKYMFS